jgi:hypothetical protein
MPLPEIANRLSRLFKGKDESATTIDIDRALTSAEHGLIEWLLAHGDVDSKSFASQLSTVRVHAKCSCGCPTIDLVVPEPVPSAASESRILADFMGKVNSTDVGVLLFQSGGRLSCLEIYAFGDNPEPFGLPDITSLHRWEETAPNRQGCSTPL